MVTTVPLTLNECKHVTFESGMGKKHVGKQSNKMFLIVLRPLRAVVDLKQYIHTASSNHKLYTLLQFKVNLNIGLCCPIGTIKTS